MEVEDSGFCRIGEIVLIGGQEARTVLSKSSLIFRSPLQINYPEGTVVRHLRDNEFLQLEGGDLYVYAQDPEGEAHLVCCVDMIQRETPERAEERDDIQDQFIQMTWTSESSGAVDARLAAQRPVVSGGGGVMTPPWLFAQAHEWEDSRADRQVPPLPEFGKKEEGDQTPRPRTPVLQSSKTGRDE